VCLLINHIILIKRLFFHLGVNEMFFEELLRILIQCQDLFEIISALKTLGVFVLHVNQRSVNLLEVKLKNFSIDFLFELRKFLYDLVPIFLGYSIPLISVCALTKNIYLVFCIISKPPIIVLLPNLRLNNSFLLSSYP
jgi:hypothetical protein